MSPSTKKDYYCGEVGGFFGAKIECRQFSYDYDAKNYFGCQLKDKSSYHGSCEKYNLIEDTSWDDGCFPGFKRIKCKLKNPPEPAPVPPPAPVPAPEPALPVPPIHISKKLSINNKCNK